jgi:uncharacterized protein YbjT (DUF2867 family)
MSNKKLIVILGATGNQGGSVAEVFLQEPEWRVRAVTRNPASAKAQALAARGGCPSRLGRAINSLGGL